MSFPGSRGPCRKCRPEQADLLLPGRVDPEGKWTPIGKPQRGDRGEAGGLCPKSCTSESCAGERPKTLHRTPGTPRAPAAEPPALGGGWEGGACQQNLPPWSPLHAPGAPGAQTRENRKDFESNENTGLKQCVLNFEIVWKLRKWECATPELAATQQRETCRKAVGVRERKTFRVHSSKAEASQ